MAKVASGDLDGTVEVTGADEIGLLEQVLGETILNMKFSREALAEHADKLEERVRRGPQVWQRRSLSAGGPRKRRSISTPCCGPSAMSTNSLPERRTSLVCFRGRATV